MREVERLKIGQVASRAGVGVETVRFYERHGLVEEPPRTESGYRQYSDEVVGRLRFIQRAKSLGFSLNEIKELISLRLGAETSRKRVRSRAEGKLREVDQKLRDLQRMRQALIELLASCDGATSTDECPILTSLSGEDP